MLFLSPTKVGMVRLHTQHPPSLLSMDGKALNVTDSAIFPGSRKVDDQFFGGTYFDINYTFFFPSLRCSFKGVGMEIFGHIFVLE